MNLGLVLESELKISERTEFPLGWSPTSVYSGAGETLSCGVTNTASAPGTCSLSTVLTRQTKELCLDLPRDFLSEVRDTKASEIWKIARNALRKCFL